MNGNIIPFGKYRGQTVESVAESDPQYLDWLANQGWVQSKCPTLYQVIINNYCEPSETPEHNEMQAKFLYVEFRSAVGLAIFNWFDWRIDCRGYGGPVEYCGATDAVQFENGGADVQFYISLKATPTIDSRKTWIRRDHSWFSEDKIEEEAKKQEAAEPFYFDKKLIRVEIKPSIGDDYPSVLRQMQRSKCEVLFVRNYTGVGVDEKTFFRLFHSQKIIVIFEREVISSLEKLKNQNPVPGVPGSVPGFSGQPGTTYLDDL